MRRETISQYHRVRRVNAAKVFADPRARFGRECPDPRGPLAKVPLALATMSDRGPERLANSLTFLTNCGRAFHEFGQQLARLSSPARRFAALSLRVKGRVLAVPEGDTKKMRD